MNKKYLKLALITSPIIALYGVAPLFLLQQVAIGIAVKIFFALMFLVAVFWAINLVLFPKFKLNVTNIVLSYLTTFLFQFIFMQIGIYFNVRPSEGNISLMYVILSTFAINSIILTLLNMQMFRIQKEVAENEVQKLKMSNLEAQKHVLMQQLQPHFLFNSLTVLKSLISENQPAAENYTQKLSDFLRYSVLSNDNEIVNFEDELKFTKDFIEMQKMRFGNAIKVNFELDLKVNQHKIPIFALQTLVENAIKHNAFTEKKPLAIHIKNHGNQLVISNNVAAKRNLSPSGTGLKNLNERYLITCNKPIQIEQNKEQFTVTIDLL